jgi:hypothetical protein
MEFRHRFEWVWPTKKNNTHVERRGRRYIPVPDKDVVEAEATIALELERAIRREFGPRDRSRSLFGANDVRRTFTYFPDECAIEVEWSDLGRRTTPTAVRGRVDLTNLGALLDDAVGRRRMGRLWVPGIVYDNDVQIVEAHEWRSSTSSSVTSTDPGKGGSSS